MYGGNALLFKDPEVAASYLRYLRTGNLGEAGQLLIDSLLLPVDIPLQATLVEHKDGEGPSHILLDLDALPPTYKRSNWTKWADCYVFNLHLVPSREEKLSGSSQTIVNEQGRPIMRSQPKVRFEIKRDANGSLVVSGNTNLPDGTKLGVQLFGSGDTKDLATPGRVKDYGGSELGRELSSLDREIKNHVKNSGLLGQDYKVFVQKGRFFSAGFSRQGAPFPSGEYKAQVMLYRNVFWQTGDILKQIGEAEKEISWFQTASIGAFRR